MSYPETGLRSDIVTVGRPAGYEGHQCWNGILGLGILGLRAGGPDSAARTTHWLPVAVTKIPISCCRDGFPRPVVFKKRRDERRPWRRPAKVQGSALKSAPTSLRPSKKGKTQAFSCVIADWADQPEASFLLKRARESAPNRDTVAIAIVDHEPTAAEMRDNRLDFLIYRPISAEEADAVLAKACEQMQPLSAEDAEESSRQADASSEGPEPSFRRRRYAGAQSARAIQPVSRKRMQQTATAAKLQVTKTKKNLKGAVTR